MSFIEKLSNLLSMQDLINGITATLIISFFTYMIRIINNRIKMQKCLIEGTYVAHYEDIVESNKRTVSGSVTIKQKGLNITGSHIDIDNRQWLLKGTIYDKIHCSGIYSSTTETDSSNGSFYFKINRDKNALEGFWSGFDSVNNIISSGKYDLSKETAIEIKMIEKKDIDEILNFSQDLFGEGYITNIDSYMDSRNSISLVAIDIIKNKIVGYSLSQKCSQSSLAEIIKETKIQDHDLKRADNNNTLGIIKTIAVKPEYQGKGIGRKLIVQSEAGLEKLDVSTIIIPAWRYGDNVNIANTLLSLNYKQFKSNNSHWKSECERNLFSCPKKTKNRCVCGVDFYKKSLQSHLTKN